MLSDFTGADKVYIACGYTDLRKGIDGLASMVQQQFQLDPFTNTLFLFCGRRRDRIKGLYWEKDGFILLLMHFAEYRMELPIREVMVFPNGHAYYVCPRCNITLEREFMSYCDRCGQHLGWNSYRKAKVIYPGNREEVHT